MSFTPSPDHDTSPGTYDDPTPTVDYLRSYVEYIGAEGEVVAIHAGLTRLLTELSYSALGERGMCADELKTWCRDAERELAKATRHVRRLRYVLDPHIQAPDEQPCLLAPVEGTEAGIL